MRRAERFSTVVLFSAAVVASAVPACAHPLAPALLEIESRSNGDISVLWKTPFRKLPGTALAPRLPESCEAVGASQVEVSGNAIIETAHYRCDPARWIGAKISIDGLDETETDALVRIKNERGNVSRAVLSPGRSSYVIPESGGAFSISTDYVRLGFDHILSGPDHLLFVFALMLLIASFRSLVATITAFTVGHSITLSLAVLGIVRVPSAPTEILIAASIYVLAVEAAGVARGRRGPFSRRPWILAAGFGLLHGLGFAGALREAGLPEGDVPLALFSFNVGIEIGQIAFVTALALAGLALRYVAAELPKPLRLVPSYIVGTAAIYWVIERTLAAFSL
jgi:hydrogenase/urease accessory protein HupE